MHKGLLAVFGQRWRELAGFALLFRVFESVLLIPAAGLAGQWLLGRTVLDSTAVVKFLLSPRGFTALALGAVTLLALRLVEHAGLSAIFCSGFGGHRITLRQTFHLVGGNLLTILNVSARLVGAGFLAVLPLLIVSGLLAAPLLKRHDVNYYLHLHPPEFIAAATIIGIAAAATAAVTLCFIVRWRWVIQVVLFRHKEAGPAFTESAMLTQGRRWRLLLILAGLILLSLFLSLIASGLEGVCTLTVLGVTNSSDVALAIAFGLLLLLRTMIGATLTFVGSCLDAGVFTLLFLRRAMDVGLVTSLAVDERVHPPAALRWLPLALGGVLCTTAASGTLLGLDAMTQERSIAIHAHRGVTINAPENTLAAVRAAIAAGADYVETDVQLSKDDVLVIAHDSDFSRLGGVARKVWDLTYDEIRAIPLGVRAAPEFRQETSPTLDELLAEAKGRIKVNIELKYYGDHQPGLARKVVDAVRKRGMLDDVVIQCLEYNPLLDVRQVAPEVPTGYLLSFNAREPARLKVDFLSVEQRRLDRQFILKAHHRGLQVFGWTVNTAKDMKRMLDLGVDGVITDQVQLARTTVENYLNRPASERVVRRVRAWLAE